MVKCHLLFTLRQNWLEENHVIGRLLKPHTRNTIFINFAARNTLVAEEGSGVQRMFSVFSVFPYISVFSTISVFLGISLHLGISLLLSILSISLHLPKIHRGSVCILWHSYACQSNVQVGRDGAMQLIAEEMSSRYSWPAEAFPRMMEERGFPQNQSDQLKGFHYR